MTVNEQIVCRRYEHIKWVTEYPQYHMYNDRWLHSYYCVIYYTAMLISAKNQLISVTIDVSMERVTREKN